MGAPFPRLYRLEPPCTEQFRLFSVLPEPVQKHIYAGLVQKLI